MASQENILDKQIDYFKEKDENINKIQTNMVKNQADMVKALTKLTQVMNMAFSWATNNNDNIQVPILASKIGNDENENDALL